MVLGNTDADLLDPPRWYAHPDSPELPDSAQRVYAISAWCHAQLTPEDFDYLRTFLPTVTIPLNGRDSLLGFHGSPRAATDVIRSTTSDDELDLMLASATAQVLAGGHVHVPLLRNHRGRMVLNPGSVGFPFASYGFSGQVPVLPEAQYAVVSAVDGLISVEFRRIAVDVDAVIESARSSGMPHAEWWSALWVRP
jgi:diadenosine tetraphosphatase ApaH/serine/threonine PP2A family protein phosphatase